MPALLESFDSAALYLSNSPALSRISNEVKLELYALFKCITVSKRPQMARPSLFDFTGRAKWDAWDKLGRMSENVDRDEWIRRYLDIARAHGWDGAVSLVREGSSADQERPREGGGGGMGVSVSIVAKPPAGSEDAKGVHGCAVTGDVDSLAVYLKGNPNDLDTRDSYGYTALHLGADRGHEAVVKMLLEHGADPNIQDADEFTAAQLAEIAGHHKIAQMLLHA